jgi:tetraacyldisaccharide 4'-kinase
LVIGNLTVGGTGKTPMVMYVSNLLRDTFSMAVLSRGHGRNTKGYLELNEQSRVAEVGDEPLEIFENLDSVPVVVCENRIQGIDNISNHFSGVNLVLLDDGFQHLPLKANGYLLLCNYHNPFYSDWVMPSGRLREFAFSAKNADIIVVSKCPSELDEREANTIKARLEKYSSNVFFASYQMSKPLHLMDKVSNLAQGEKVILVTGVANGEAVKNQLNGYEVLNHFDYADHKAFDANNIKEWLGECLLLKVQNIIVTRKDAGKIKDIIKMNNIDNQGISFYEIHTEVVILFNQEKQFKNSLINLI